jgi:CRP-like cAMP-binding protein
MTVLAQLQPDLEPITLPVRRILADIGQPMPYVYFLDRGIAAMVVRFTDDDFVVVTPIGHEGMVGLPIVHGVDTVSTQVFIHAPGTGVRIAASAFRQAADTLPPLRTLLGRYTHALMTQLAQAVACNRAHSLEQRAAYWLLQLHDRSGGDQFPLTQTALARMLGVHRPSTSLAASALREAGLITYHRGQVTVRDRTGLEARACRCYAVVRAEFDRVVPA